MNMSTAEQILSTTSYDVHGMTLTSKVVGDRIVFSGSRTGEHSIALQHTDFDRFLAHWKGYIRNAQAAAA